MPPPNSPSPDDDDGWTHISNHKSKSKSHRPVLLPNSLPPISRDTTLSKIQTHFRATTKKWQSSSCRAQVLRILSQQQPDAGWHLTTALCLATGSYSRDNAQLTQRSMQQFVVFHDLAVHLHSIQDDDVLAMYAQEPAYTPLDAEFLRALDVGVLETTSRDATGGLGAVAQHLGGGSFVFEPFMDMTPQGMRELCASDAALYIGSSLQRWSGG